MNLKKMFNSLLILVVFALVANSATLAATWYVSATNGDDIVFTGTQAQPYKTIGKAIQSASDGDVISIAADTYNEGGAALTINKSLTFVSTVFNALEVVTITNGITINGTGKTINMGRSSDGSLKFNLGTTAAALTLTDGTLNIDGSNVIIGNGATITRTGAILNGTPTVTNVNVTYGGTADLTAGGELPASLGTGTLTVNIGGAKTLSVNSAVSFAEAGMINVVAGGVNFTGNVQFSYSANLGPAAVIVNGGAQTVAFSNAVAFNRSAGTISAVLANVGTGNLNFNGGVSNNSAANITLVLQNLNTGKVTLAGGTINGDVTNNAGGTIDITASSTFSGANVVNTGAASRIKLNAVQLTLSGTTTLNNTGKIISVTDGTVGTGLLAVTGTVIANGGGDLSSVGISGTGKLTLGASATVFGSVTLSSNTAGALTDGGFTLSVKGDFIRSNNTVGNVVGTGTLDFSGTGAQNFNPGASLTLANITVNKTAGTAVTMLASVVVTDAVTITTGNLNLNDFNITLTGNPGVFTNAGSFYSTTGNGYIIFQGLTGTLSGNGTFGNILINTTGGGDVTAATNLKFSGTLVLYNGNLAMGANTLTLNSDNVTHPTIRRKTDPTTAATATITGTLAVSAGVTINVEYIGGASVAASSEWSAGTAPSLYNLSVKTTGGRTITGPASASTIAGTLTVDGTEILNLNAQVATLSGAAMIHSAAGSVTNGTLNVTGNGAYVNGSTTTAHIASVNNLTVNPGAGNSFTSANLKVISGNLLVTTGNAEVAMNTTTATLTGNATLTAGSLNLNMNSTASSHAGNIVVTAGTFTYTRGAAGQQNVGGTVSLNGGTLSLGSNVNVTGQTTIAAGSLALNSFNYTQLGSAATPDINRTGAGSVTGTGTLVLDATAAAIDIAPGATFSVPKVELKGAANGITFNAPMTIAEVLTHTDGAVALSTLTFAGTAYNYTAGTYASGTLVLTGAATTATLSGNVTIPNVTLNSTGTVTVASNNTTARSLTVGAVFTQTAGTIALGANSLILTGGAGAYVRTAGTITMDAGRLVLNGAGLTFNPGTGFAVDNLSVLTAAANSTANTWTVVKSLILGAALQTSTAAANDKLLLGDGATIERQAAGAVLSNRPVFGATVNLAYTTGAGPYAVGVEVPTTDIINNFTVSNPGGVTLGNSQALKVNGTLSLATLLDAMTANPDAAVTMANGATLELKANGTAVLDKDLVRAGTLNIIYNGANATTVRELGPTTNATTHTAGNVTFKSTVALDAAATFTGTVTFDGGDINQAGANLFVQGNIAETTNGGFFNPNAVSTLTFNGADDQTITLNAAKSIDAQLNIVINKTNATNKVELAGTKSSLDFATNAVTLAFVNGLLVTNDNTVKLMSPGTANQGFNRDGVTGTNVSHIVGNVVKNIAGTGRFTFPVGSLTKYRPVSFVFATAPIYAFNATVNHKNESPLGTAGLPIVDGVAPGKNITTYPEFYWLIKSDVPLGTATTFNLELTGAGFTDFAQVSDLRIIRRVDGDAVVNPWVSQGANYDNFLVGSDPTVANLSSTGGINPAGARFSYGLNKQLGYIVSGTVKYDNTAASNMAGVIVTLTPASGAARKDTTDAQGAYSFANVATGSYTVSASSSANWLGASAVDALLVANHYAGKALLADLKLVAADVNNSNTVNNTDALLILKKAANSSVVFAKGNWVFTSAPVTVASANVVANLKGLSTGDINANGMGALAKSSVQVKSENKIAISKKNVISLPIKAVNDMNVGAMQLVFKYPAELVTFDGVSSKAADIVSYDDKEGKVVLAWADLSAKDGLNMKAGEALVTLKFKSNEELKAGSQINVELNGAASEIANINGEVYANAALDVASLEVTKPTQFALSNNYPNPFNPATTIKYALPVDARVSLVVFNTLGEEVATLVNSNQAVGEYEVSFNASHLTSGVYFYRLTVNAGEQNFTQTHKMILMK